MQISEALFRTRAECPGCSSGSYHVLFGPVEYTDPRIKGVLEATWSGKADWEYLHNYLTAAEYCLLQCKRCTCVWQRDVPSSQLLDVLLEDLSPSRIYAYSVEDFEHLDAAIAKKLDGNHRIVDDNRPPSPFWQAITTHSGPRAIPDKRRSKDYRGLAEQILLIRTYFRRRNITALDFGMGQGEWCRLAAAFGLETYGLEYSEEKSSWRLDGGYGVITPRELSEHRFDFINTEQVFEHLNDPLDTLKRLVQSLNQGGVIRINVPNGFGIEQKLQSKESWTAAKGAKHALSAVRPLRHVNCFTGKSLTAMAAQAGLQRVDRSLRQMLSSAIGLQSVLSSPLRWARYRLQPDRVVGHYYVKR